MCGLGILFCDAFCVDTLLSCPNALPVSAATFNEFKEVGLEFPGSAETRVALELSFKKGHLTNSRCALLLVVCLTQTIHEFKLSPGLGCFPDIIRSAADTKVDS